MGLEQITPTRTFNLLYIILDSIFIIILIGLLLWKKKKSTLYFSLFGGILYFLVDYGYFYLISHSRIIYYNETICNNSITALILLWMSLSYGITNFAFIWLCLKKDEHLKEFLLLIIGWWLIIPSIASLGGANNIMTYRTTTAYHGYMALLLAIGYFILIIYNLCTSKEKRVNLLWLNGIGISVQFAWEFALLINGIRPFNENSLFTLIVDSLIETNLGMPIIFGIYKVVEAIHIRKQNQIAMDNIE